MPLSPRKILHIDMDAFYASVEQRDDPSLRDKPVVIAQRGSRSVVCAASYEARRFGIHSAMPALRAERLCPQAVFVAPDFERYRAVSAQIRAIFAEHTALIEPLSLDEAYLDVSHPRSSHGSATAIARDIRQAIRERCGLTASAGIAPNKFLAKIASDWNKPDGLCVIRPEQALDFLSPLEVNHLPGVGKVMSAKLQALQLHTVAELRSCPAALLEQQFGRWGRRLHELAHGIDNQPVRPFRIAKQISSESTFAQDLSLLELEAPIRRLAAQTWAAYQRPPKRLARTIVLKLKTADFRTLTRHRTLIEPPRSAEELASLACDLRQRVTLPPTIRYRLVGVGLSGFADGEQLQAQGELFEQSSNIASRYRDDCLNRPFSVGYKDL